MHGSEQQAHNQQADFQGSPIRTYLNRGNGGCQKDCGTGPGPRPPAEEFHFFEALVERPEQSDQEQGDEELDVDGLEGGMGVTVHR